MTSETTTPVTAGQAGRVDQVITRLYCSLACGLVTRFVMVVTTDTRFRLFLVFIININTEERAITTLSRPTIQQPVQPHGLMASMLLRRHTVNKCKGESVSCNKQNLLSGFNSHFQGIHECLIQRLQNMQNPFYIIVLLLQCNTNINSPLQTCLVRSSRLSLLGPDRTNSPSSW